MTKACVGSEYDYDLFCVCIKLVMTARGSEKGQCPHRGRPSTPKTYLEAVARTKSRACKRSEALGSNCHLLIHRPPLSLLFSQRQCRTHIHTRT